MGLFRPEKEDEQSKAKRPPLFLEARSSKWFILTVVATAIFTDLFLYGVIVPVIPFALRSRVGVQQDNVQHWVSIMLAVYAAGLLAFSPVWGWFADHTRSRGAPFLMGLIALVGATALLCVGNTITIIVVGRLLQGISAALVWTVGLAIVSDTVGKDQLGEAMGWVTLGIGIAIFTGPMLGGIVFARAGYYAVFGMTFGIVGLDIAMRLLMIEASIAKQYRVADETAESQPNSSEPKLPNPIDTTVEPEEIIPTRSKRKVPTLLILLCSPRLLSGLWGCMIVALLLTSFDSVLPLYVNSIFKWDSTGAGLIFLPICLPSFLEPLIGRLGDKIGVRWIVVGGFISALPFFVLLRLVTYDSLTQKVLLCMLLFLLGLSVSLVMPPLMAEVTLIVSDREREEPGIFGDKSAFAQAYALFNMAYAAGTCVGPLWAGFVAQTAGWGTMAWTLGLLSGVTAVPMAVWTGGSALDIKRRKEEGKERESGERRPMSEAEAEGDADSGNGEISRNV